MKLLIPSLLALGLSTPAFAGPQNYRVTRSNVHPLSTYEECSERSAYGYGAYLAAKAEAFDRCDADLNVDCNEVGRAIFRETISQEFIGYKTCSATVTVRGWK